eukprot:TRINITY_DN6164_c0_g1_i2.p1 TRINITY_DN6164_c0_g1~~TRINITY_DN6164_c0_g1_i2.p1  ORF type:complete len:109 (+),score=2.06 TRINITY_DN6164_c0_g1_i2:32-358(+)
MREWVSSYLGQVVVKFALGFRCLHTQPGGAVDGTVACGAEARAYLGDLNRGLFQGKLMQSFADCTTARAKNPKAKPAHWYSGCEREFMECFGSCLSQISDIERQVGNV